MRRIVYLAPKAFERKQINYIKKLRIPFAPVYTSLADKGIQHFVTREVIYACREEKVRIP